VSTSKHGKDPVESRETLERACSQAGLAMASDSQLARWRAVHLLPRVDQTHPSAYQGSTIDYPAGTAQLVVEIQRLLKIKNSLDFVGWELWWQGYSVNEKYWKPEIRKSVEPFANSLVFASAELVAEEDSDELVERNETLLDKVAKSIVENRFFSRIARRISQAQRSIFLRVFVDVARGKFSGFDTPNSTSEKSEQDIVTEALDLRDANSFRKSEKEYLDSEDSEIHAHQILGQRLDLGRQLPDVLNGLSVAAKSGKLSEVLDYPLADIEAARNDVRNAMQIGLCLHETLAYSHGPRAFGLRFVAWLLSRSTIQQKAFWVASIAMLRRYGNILLPSAEIEKMALDAVYMRDKAREFLQIVKDNPQLKKVVTPKALRAAFSDPIELHKFENRIKLISLEKLPPPKML
jgi:hypothetical protein